VFQRVIQTIEITSDHRKARCCPKFSVLLITSVTKNYIQVSNEWLIYLLFLTFHARTLQGIIVSLAVLQRIDVVIENNLLEQTCLSIANCAVFTSQQSERV